MAPKQSSRKGTKANSDASKTEKSSDKNENENVDEETNTGFGKYLKSEQGMNSMRVFVVINSLVMLLTMGVPAMKQAYEIISDWLKEKELI